MDMGIVDHSMMGHDMSDPAMARAMEADMRNRFFVSLVLTIPVILYSPLGTSLFKLHLPTPFGISPNWVLLVLFCAPALTSAFWSSPCMKMITRCSPPYVQEHVAIS